MKKALFALVFLGLLIALPSLVVAGDHKAGAHGGQIQSVGPYFLELVAKDGELRLYVTDQNNQELVETKGSSGKANVIDKDGKRVRVQLEPVFGNLMKGSGDFKITPETTVSVFVSVAARKGTQSARFDSLTSEKASAEEKAESDGHHHASDDNDKDSDDDNGSSDSVY
jgi:hypothetical protein